MSELPPGWAKTRLGLLGHYVNGRGFKAKEWGDVGRPIIRIQNLTGTSATFNYFDGAIDSRYLVAPGDLLVSWAATLGAFFWRGPEALLNQHIFKVESFINKRFHKYLVDYALGDLVAKTHGSGMVHITRKPFDETTVLLPPLAEQGRIVAAIEEQSSRIDAGVMALERVGENLKRMRASVLQTTVSGELVSSFARARFGDLLREPLRNGHSAKASGAGTVPILTLTAVTAGDFSPRNIKMTAADPKRVIGLWLQSGDLLIERSNTRELVGTARLYTGANNLAVFPDLVIRARVNESLLPRFAEMTLQAPSTRLFFQRRAQGISGSMPKIDQSVIEDLQLPVPPISIQAAVVSQTDRQLSLISALEIAATNAKRRAGALRQSILRSALSGELFTRNPADESASVLLKRIAEITRSSSSNRQPNAHLHSAASVTK